MGNQITATAPAQILPLESYFNELTEYSKPIRLDEKQFPLMHYACCPIYLFGDLCDLIVHLLNFLVSVWEVQGFSRLPVLGTGEFIRN